VLADLLERARVGRGGVSVLRGEAGIGKSALLDLAVGLAPGFGVLRALGTESESGIAFAGLQELVRPVAGLVAGLPERQRAVLAGALALGPPVPGDPLAVRAATLSLLAAAAERAPLLVVVDDAQWLDSASADALAFAARRLAMDGVVALFALRDAEPSAFDSSGLPELRIDRLGEQSARVLLAERSPCTIAPQVVDQLVRVAHGNPLALLEVPAALSEAQRSGREALEEPLPVGTRVERAFTRRLDRLPPDARAALLLAAASGADEPSALASALRARGLSQTAFARAEHDGLIAIAAGRTRFTHPLVRSVAYQSASSEQRRAAHAALAAALDESADRRAWHLAAAATGPDETIAAALEDAAARAADRAELATAARTHQRAAALTPQAGTRAQRLLAAATLAYASGKLDWASALVREGRPVANTSVLRADLQWLAAAVGRDRGSVIEARRMLWESAARIASRDPTRAALMLIDAMHADVMSGNERAALASGQHARDYAAASSPTIRHLVGVLAESVAINLGATPADQVDLTKARSTAASALDLYPAGRTAVEMLWAAWYAVAIERSGHRDDDELDLAIARARQRGALGVLPYLLGMGAQLDFREDRWTRARVRANEALELAEQTGQRTYRSWGLVNAAIVEAAQGREEACRAHAHEALELVEAAGIGSLAVYLSSTLGFLELGLGHASAAVERLEQCARTAAAAGLAHPNVVRYEADLVEALLAAGREQDALEAADLLERRAERVSSSWGLAMATRCRGLLAEAHDFDDVFRAALVLHESVPSAFERARTELCYGERLRRARRRTEAREHLTRAFAVFERLSAVPWATRARRELQATDISARPRRDQRMTETLTPQELRVVLLVAAGATIREAAGQLFLSPKTIEAHLGRAYRKLGVHNRAQLATRLAHQQPAAA
jgi:DNA-binding CsgD family transcriptional regulator